jgi:hypothetical protein
LKIPAGTAAEEGVNLMNMEVLMKHSKSIWLPVWCMAVMAIGVMPLGAQVQGDNEIVTPPAQFQDHGGVTPWFWIGLKTLFSGGYNMETNAAGFRNYGGDNYTYASFNLAFVDSQYQTPKFYEVPRNIDPNAWTGKFKLMNFTSKINSWEDGTSNRSPSWLAEISGKGAHIGFFTQAGFLIGSMDDDQSDNKPRTSLSAGNTVLQLEDDDLGKTIYEKSRAGNVTTYNTSNGALWYTGYEKPELFNTYLSMLSEGNVNSDISGGKNDGFAAALDFQATPLGLFAEEGNPLTFAVTGNAITGWRFETDENFGFGLKTETGIWLRDNFVLTPTAAFDGRMDVNNTFTWKTGGGLVFRFSGMRWISDGEDWNELSQISNLDFRYENNKILKYAYAQVYAAYSEKDDLDLVFKLEEPDGDAGWHEKLGAMAEFRLYNLTDKVTTNALDWAVQGRVSYDLAVKSYLVTPYIRSYLDSSAVLKLRVGAQANIIPYTGFEIAYTSANLNAGAKEFTFLGAMSHYSSSIDAGRLELIVILQSDNIRPKTPKRMNDWNYPD